MITPFKKFIALAGLALVALGGCTSATAETPSTASGSIAFTRVATTEPTIPEEIWPVMPTPEAVPQRQFGLIGGPATNDPRCARPTDTDLSFLIDMLGGPSTPLPDVAVIVQAFTRPTGARYIIATRTGDAVQMWATNQERVSYVSFPDSTGYLQWTDDEKAAGQAAAVIATACL
jgi:hypothetical protein